MLQKANGSMFNDFVLKIPRVEEPFSESLNERIKGKRRTLITV